MKCKDIKNLLSPYLEGELNKEERVKLESHLEGCPACKKELTLLEAAIKNVKDLEEVAAPVNLIDKINERLDKKSFQHRLSSIWERVSLPIAIPTLAKSLALASFIFLLLYLVTGPGRVYFSKVTSKVRPPSQVALEEVAELHLTIPQPAGNIPRPGSYCIAPAKMAEARRAIGIFSSCFLNPKAMAKGRQELKGRDFFLPAGNKRDLPEARQSLPSPKIFKNHKN